MRFLLFAAMSLLPVLVFSQEMVKNVELPKEVKEESSNIPKELEGKVWNRWTSENFVVLSVNDTYAQYLHKNIESMKTWALERWGFPDVVFSRKCKIICVDDPKLYEMMFKMNHSSAVTERNKRGLIEENTIFMLANRPPSETIPSVLTAICLREFAQQYDTELDFWTIRGICLLNSPLNEIKRRIVTSKTSVAEKKSKGFAKSLFEMEGKRYGEMSHKNKKLCDDCTMMLVLMLRQEFGQNKFHWLIKRASDTGPEQAIKTTLGFSGYDEFDKSYKAFIFDLIKMTIREKVPDSYFMINPVQ